MPVQQDGPAEWLTEAHQIISEWEHAQGRGLRLGLAEASDLATRVAQALAEAYARGKAAR